MVNSDKTDSLFIGNLDITPLNIANTWRMNIDDINNENFQKLANENASLPNNNGVFGFNHSIYQNNAIEKRHIGTLICTKRHENKFKLQIKCW